MKLQLRLRVSFGSYGSWGSGQLRERLALHEAHAGALRASAQRAGALLRAHAQELRDALRCTAAPLHRTRVAVPWCFHGTKNKPDSWRKEQEKQRGETRRTSKH